MRREGAVLLALGLCALPACTAKVGNGMVVEQTLAVGYFDSVRVTAPVRVDVRAGGTQSVVLRAESNLAPLFNLHVDGQTLVVEAGPVAPMVPVRVLVTVPTVQSVEASGGSECKVTQVTQGLSAFAVSASDGSLVSVQGAQDLATAPTPVFQTVTAQLRGGSELDMQALVVSALHLDASGGSRAEVPVSSQVDGTLAGGSRLVVDGRANTSLVVTRDGSTVTRR